MLILPIVNKKRVMNVEIRLKDAKKVRHHVSYDDAGQSEIIVNHAKFSESSFFLSREENAPTDFIRSRSILYPRSYLITTKQERSSVCYDVYQVEQPPKKATASFDRLYGKAILDLKNEIPGVESRGRYVSFEDLGMREDLSNEKIARVQRIVKEETDKSRWPQLFQDAGVADMKDMVDFIRHFECTVLSDHSIPEDSLQDTLKAMEAIHTRDYKNLKKYYETAKSNTDIYTKISYLHKVIYDKPFAIIAKKSVDPKQYIKKKEEVDYAQAA